MTRITSTLTACACAALLAVTALPIAPTAHADAIGAMHPRLAARGATAPVFDTALASPSSAPRRDTRIVGAAADAADGTFASSAARRDNRLALADAAAPGVFAAL